MSETTIYREAVPLEGGEIEEISQGIQNIRNLQKRCSSSSEDGELIDTSDELIQRVMPTPTQDEQLIESGGVEQFVCNDQVLFQQFLEYKQHHDGKKQQHKQKRDDKYSHRRDEDDAGPSTSRDSREHSRGRDDDRNSNRRLLQQAEASKARMMDVPGKPQFFSENDLLKSLIMDEKYDLIEIMWMMQLGRKLWGVNL